MNRVECELMEGWEFALNEPLETNYNPVHLPHDWVIHSSISENMEQGAAQGYRERLGTGWYRQSLDIENKKEGYCYYLDFGGIFEDSTIWINGTIVGGRKYGYSPFTLDITDSLQEGNNTIEIKVNNTHLPADRWYSGAGIYRKVKFIEVHKNHFDKNNIIITTKLIGSDAQVYIDTGMDTKVSAKLSSENFCEDVHSDNGKLQFNVSNPKLWSAETPNLYNLKLSLYDDTGMTDMVTMSIGIREITFSVDEGMVVNGKRTKLKGVCVHQDVGCRGIAAKKEIWRERLLLLKESGCNTIRPSHHVFSEEFLDLCDEIGFYVYEEPFDKWTGGLYGRYFESEWKKDIEAMVKRDRNRTCIVIWGVGNEVENQAQDSMIKILKMLTDHVRLLDNTRPVTYAMNPHFKRESKVDVSKIKDIQKFVDEVDDTEIFDIHEKVERISRIAEHVDIISCNYMEQWYPYIHQAIPNKLILGTEIYQYFKGFDEQFQNFTDENPSLVPLENDYVMGGIIWTGYDYLGESMGYPSKGWSGSLIRTNMQCRASYYMMQSYWSDHPMVRLMVMDYSLEDELVKEHWDIPPYAEHWHFPQFKNKVIPYMIASNCDEVALFVNDKRLYIPKPADCPNRLITGFVPYKPGIVKVIGYKDGIEVCQHELKTPDQVRKLEFFKEEYCVDAEKGYELLLNVSAKDKKGTHYFRESRPVHFRIEGNAEIIGVDNGSFMGNEPYNGESIHMYNGVASVQIRLHGEPGRVIVYADADGLAGGKVIIRVGEK